jgi:hypothetical protein
MPHRSDLHAVKKRCKYGAYSDDREQRRKLMQSINGAGVCVIFCRKEPDRADYLRKSNNIAGDVVMLLKGRSDNRKCRLGRFGFLWVLILAICVVSLAMTGKGFTQAPAKPSGEGSGTSVLESIQREAKEAEQLRAALQSPDQSVRLAAFWAMVNSGNPAFAEMAITTAFANADQATKALAVRAAFASVQVMEVELSLPQDASVEAKKELGVALANSWATITDIKYDLKSGKFQGSIPHGIGSGQVSGMTISFQTPGCSGTLNNKEGTWIFQGKVRCNASTYPGTFRLR